MKIALLFPGQGSQKIGMGKDIHENFEAARRVYEEASDALKMNIAKLCFEGPESELIRTENTQPAVLVTSIALLRAIEGETGVRPAIAAGHSLGEYSAIVAAKGLDLGDAARIVRLRGRFMQEAVPEGEGGMAAIIGMDTEKVEELCRDAAVETGKIVVASNYNSPEQVAISGHTEAVGRARELAEQRGAKRVVPLRVSAPFHSPLMKPAAQKLEPELKKLPFRDTVCPIPSNVDTEPHSRGADFAALLARQVLEPVRWTGCMKRLREHDVELAVEVGPGKALTGLLRNIDGEIKITNVEDMQSLKKAISLLSGRS